MSHIEVSIGILPGKLHKNIVLNGDRTVGAAVKAVVDSETDPEFEDKISGRQIRVNSVDATMSTPLQNGDTILFLQKIKGN